MSEDLDVSGTCPSPYAHPYRRRVRICLERYMTLSLADLADELAVWERAGSLAEIPAEDVRDIYLELYQIHLPRLEDANVLVYDQERDLVSVPGYGADAPIAVQAIGDEELDDFEDACDN